MQVILSWEQFQTFMKNQVYVVDGEDTWKMYVYEEGAALFCEVAKDKHPERNIMFEQKHFDKPNVLKVIEVITDYDGSSSPVSQITSHVKPKPRVQKVLPDSRKVDSEVVSEAMEKIGLTARDLEGLEFMKRMGVLNNAR